MRLRQLLQPRLGVSLPRLSARLRRWRTLPAGVRCAAIGALLLAACAQTGSDQMTLGRSIPIVTPAPTASAPPPIPTPIPEPTAAVPTPAPYAPPDLSGLPYEVLIQEVVRGESDRPVVAFTLDGGAIEAYTPAILQTLREHQVRVTIFITGQFAERYPELVHEMIADGHEIGNHSYGHPDFTTLSDDVMRRELKRTEEIIKNVTGITTKPWFRFPYGARHPRALDVVAREGYRSIYWTIDTIDWRHDATPELVMQRIRDRLQNGVIILAHLGSVHTKDALPDILTELDERGYRVVTVSELLYPPPDTSLPPARPTPPIIIEPTPTVVLSNP